MSRDPPMLGLRVVEDWKQPGVHGQLLPSAPQPAHSNKKAFDQLLAMHVVYMYQASQTERVAGVCMCRCDVQHN